MSPIFITALKSQKAYVHVCINGDLKRMLSFVNNYNPIVH